MTVTHFAEEYFCPDTTKKYLWLARNVVTQNDKLICKDKAPFPHRRSEVVFSTKTISLGVFSKKRLVLNHANFSVWKRGFRVSRKESARMIATQNCIVRNYIFFVISPFFTSMAFILKKIFFCSLWVAFSSFLRVCLPILFRRAESLKCGEKEAGEIP